jgi:N-acetylmuramoyl-L-alanine amidase
MLFLLRRTLFTAMVMTFAVTAGQLRAANSFSTVVIDPGHGGFDRGGIRGQRVPEKMVALDTALRLQKLLQRAGLRTVMTRSTDVFVPLPVRSAIANSERDAVFVSIHYNASPRSSAHGIETYSENNRGAALAARIQRQLVIRVSTENRGVRSAEYYVLRKCRLPAVLVECGFLTNPTATGIIEQRQFAFPPLVPSHRAGHLVHKSKKRRKVADSERLAPPAQAFFVIFNSARLLRFEGKSA